MTEYMPYIFVTAFILTIVGAGAMLYVHINAGYIEPYQKCSWLESTKDKDCEFYKCWSESSNVRLATYYAQKELICLYKLNGGSND